MHFICIKNFWKDSKNNHKKPVERDRKLQDGRGIARAGKGPQAGTRTRVARNAVQSTGWLFRHLWDFLSFLHCFLFLVGWLSIWFYDGFRGTQTVVQFFKLVLWNVSCLPIILPCFISGDFLFIIVFLLASGYAQKILLMETYNKYKGSWDARV